uniref:Uncharacterized protein n=1 Tax=Anguilla anguilla TaxID=7936 RepID=A0A0E9QUT4_ANGAN
MLANYSHLIGLVLQALHHSLCNLVLSNSEHCLV